MDDSQTPSVSDAPSPHRGAGNFVDVLRAHVAASPDKVAFRFLLDGEIDGHIDAWTYERVDLRARAIASRLRRRGLAGSRAVLVFAPGMDFVQAFLGCLYADVIAVPAYPPEPHRLERTLPRFQAVVGSAGARIALTSSMMLPLTQGLGLMAPSLASLEWIGVDEVSDDEADSWEPPVLSGETIAFLQYTSGSTGNPKGVVIRHRHVLANEAMMQARARSTSNTVLMNWVPFYHDLGLIGGVLHGLYVGGSSVLMSPLHFLQKPLRWLQAISGFQANLSAAPNFAFDLCVRKIGAEDKEPIDLACWQMALCGAEPVRAETMARFVEAFSPCGFSPDAPYPGYGMAECVLSTTGGELLGGYRTLRVDAEALRQDRVVLLDQEEGSMLLVGNGPALPAVSITVVDAATCQERSPGHIGELWLRGPHVASGYWKEEEATTETFGAVLDGDAAARPWLRTGDLGFVHDDQVYVTGRIKDLVILRGQNHYPQDLELTAETSHPAIRPGGCAAFALGTEHGEELVIVAEFDARRGDAEEASRAVRGAIAETHAAEVAEVVLVAPRAVPKTSSGKGQRRSCRARFAAGELEVVHRAAVPSDEPEQAPVAVACPPVREGGEALGAWLAALVAARLGVPPREIDPEEPFTGYGLDSRALVELSGEVAEAVGQDVSPSLFYDCPTVAKLSAHLHTERCRKLIDAAVQQALAGDAGVAEAFADEELSHLRHRMVAAAMGDAAAPGPSGGQAQLTFGDLPDLKAITNQLLEVMRASLEGYCAIYLHDPTQTEQGELSRYASTAAHQTSVSFTSRSGLTGAVFHSGEVLRVANLGEEERFKPELEAPPGGAEQGGLFVPVLRPDGRILGVLQACRPLSRPYSALDEELVGGLAEAARPVLGQALLEAQATRIRNMERQTRELVSALAVDPPLRVVLRRIVQTCLSMFDADRGSVFLYDENSDELVSILFDVLGSADEPEGSPAAEIRFQANKGIAGDVFTTGDPAWIAAPYQDPRFNPQVDKETGFVTRSLDTVPLTAPGGENIGVLQLLNRDTPGWSSEDKARLLGVATHAAHAISNTPHYRDMMRRTPEPVGAETAAPLGSAEPIAVVGMACRFPGGVRNPDEFWELLTSATDAITEVPSSRWDIEQYYDEDPSTPGKMNTRWGGFLDGVDGFDAPFFGISPREARTMDPQQRLLLQVSWEALESAAIAPEQLVGSSTGVYVGISNSDYGGRLLHARGASQLDAYAITGNAFSVAAGRVSYLLGLQGPSMPVDTACSSSLVAVHLAARALQNRDCSVALAGGVNVLLTPSGTICFSRLGAMAPDGRCKTFDASADGYVRSEGCGVVVLKRLSDAEAAGDPILGVIRGSAMNHDGRSNGLTAPSGIAQQAVIRSALHESGRRREDVRFVEAHGTGTALGDPIELQALGAVFGDPTRQTEPLLVGSVKTNIGHAEAAAGMAGMIKALLALQHRTLPPNLHFDTPTPHVPWATLGVAVPTEATPLEADGVPLLAGVSSFGIGGTNAHVLLEQAPPAAAPVRSPEPPAYLLPLSARHPKALRALAQLWIERLSPGDDLRDLVHTAATRRSQHPFRWAVIGASAEELTEALAGRVALPAPPVRSRRPERPVFVFPGQGGQWQAMGSQLLVESPVFRREIEACARAFAPHVSWSITQLLAGTADESLWRRDDVIQPALFAMQAGLLALWRSLGVEPAAVVGHSMGEVAAAYAAGALSLEDAGRIICLRSQLASQAARGGAMAVVGIPPEQAQQLAEQVPGMVVATINGPRLCVLSGERSALEEIVQRLEEEEAFARLVPVDYASHSPAMDGVRDELERRLQGEIEPQPATASWWSTVEAEDKSDAPGAAYWGSNLRQPVQFWPVVAELLERGFDTFIEINPHPVLASSVEAGFAAAGVQGVALGSIQREQGALCDLLEQRGRLYEAGHPLLSDALPPAHAAIASLPAYPWQERRHWTELGRLGEVDLPPEPEPDEVADDEELDTEACVRIELARLLGLPPGQPLDDDLTLVEQGFDSLMAVQLAARLESRHRLHLPPQKVRSVMRLRVGDLFSVILEGVAEAEPAEPGPVPLSPSQGWLLSVDPTDQHHRNVAALLATEQPMRAELLEQVVGGMAQRHDAFALRYSEAEGGMQQVLGAEGAFPFEAIDLQTVPPDEREAAIEQRCAQAHASLDLDRGPLARVLGFDLDGGGVTRLLITAHHLVIDAYALWLLLGELDAVYGQLEQGKPLNFGPRPAPWSTWARAMTPAAVTEAAEVERWIALGDNPLPDLPGDNPDGDSTYGSAATVRLEWDEAQTAGLREVARARGMGIDEVVLAGLAMSLGMVLGQPGAFVSRVVHGRVAPREGMDLARTVGFVATAHPLLVTARPGASHEEVLDATHAAFESVPGDGTGFTALLGGEDRELAARLAALPAPQVRFNVVGDLVGRFEEMTRFKLDDASDGPRISLRRQREAELDLWGMIRGGKLQVLLEHSADRLSPAMAQALGGMLASQLRKISRLA